MCGIFAAFTGSREGFENKEEVLSKVGSTLRRRGPDNVGIRYLADNRLVMLHTRLAIQDISSSSNQPISHREDSRSALVYNGEIYNAKDLISRHRLYRDSSVKEDSDTSVLLALLRKSCPKEFLGDVDGMVAFCFYDSSSNSLWFYRDHTGQKPLYYYYDLDSGESVSDIEVSSSISAFRAFNDKRIFSHADDLSIYLYTSYLPPGKTLYKNVYSCVPGFLYRFDCKSGQIESKYIDERMEEDSADLAQRQKRAFDDMKGILVGSRNLGVLLSGGIDSSLVTSCLADSRLIKRSYTLHTPSTEGSIELENAISISRSLDIDHTLIPYNIDEVVELATDVAAVIDHPNPDPSILPTTLIGKYASDQSTVLLTGDGADEHFGGYSRYGAMIKRYGDIYPHLPKKAKRLVLYWYLSSFGSIHNRVQQLMKYREKKLLDSFLECESNSLLSDLCYIDSHSYMHQHTLPKTDRALMYSSIEGRSPFLLRSFRSLGKYITDSRPLEPDKKYIRDMLVRSYPGYRLNSQKKGFSADLRTLFMNDVFATTMKESCQNAVSIFEGSARRYAVDISKELNRHPPSSSILRRAWHVHTVVKCYERLR